MRLLLLLMVAVGAGAWFLPAYIQDTPNACAAFESKLGGLLQAETRKLPQGMAADPRVAGMMGFLSQAVQAANGMLAEIYIRQNFPQLPPTLGCVAAYWRITFDPDLSQYVKGRLPFPK